MKLQLTFSDYLWSALFLLGMAVCFSEAGHAQAWSVTGNAGTNCTSSPCGNFIGTTDNSSFEIDVNGQRAFRIEPVGLLLSNIIGGYQGNYVAAGSPGATIAGGGASWRNLNGNVAVNRVTAGYSAVSGGADNQAGPNNPPGTDLWFATVAGGMSNLASGTGSAVSGGFLNTASATYSSVGGGSENTASGPGSMVGAGQHNTASGDNSFVTGYYNTASGTDSVVIGGGRNIASGSNATAVGGAFNTASGIGSLAAGYYADTNHHYGAFVWGDTSTFGSKATVAASVDNQFVARAVGGFQLITGVDNSGNPDPAKTVSITGGRVSLGMYIQYANPTTALFDQACTDIRDLAISGGAFIYRGGALRESRPLSPNAWRFTCTDLTTHIDTPCSQIYVVCLTHASQ